MAGPGWRGLERETVGDRGRAGHWKRKMSLFSPLPGQLEQTQPESNWPWNYCLPSALKLLTFRLTDMVSCKRWPFGKVSLHVLSARNNVMFTLLSLMQQISVWKGTFKYRTFTQYYYNSRIILPVLVNINRALSFAIRFEIYASFKTMHMV